jgi:alpha-mannosidase
MRKCFALLFLCLLFIPLLAQDKPAPAPPDPFKPVLDRLQSISVLPLDQWRSHEGNIAHGEDASLTDSEWQPIKINEPWTNGSQWIRTTITIPERQAGYDLRGTRIDLDLALSSSEAIQINLFANGSLIARTDEDTQLPVTLTSNAQPGQKFVIAARITGSPVKTSFRRAQLIIHAPQDRPDPSLLRMEILSARPVASAYEAGKQQRMQQIDTAIKAIDITALDRADQNEFDASLRESHKQLEALRPYLDQFTIRVSGNSHIDMAWLWPETETVEVVRNTFSSALQMMREYPDLTFTMASAQTYAWMEEKYPDLFKEIQQRVKEGRWEIVGGMWVEPDLNLPDGESLVRQILIGKRYFQQKFGVDVKIGWNPDSFGYNWQLPQIYKRAGMDYFVTQKIYWNDTTKFPYKLFWWEAPDGSRLLTYFPHDYANSVDGVKMASDLSMYAPAMWKANAGTNSAKPGELEMMFLFGVGDHGGGPTRKDLDIALGLKAPGVIYPKVKFGTAGSYFADLEKRIAELNVPTWKDELYFEYHRGVQTTQAKTKKGNRKAEVLMLNAEKLASIDTLFGSPYPEKRFDTAWKDLLFNQFHDILPGSGIAINYVDAARKYEIVDRIATDSINSSLRDLTARIDTRRPSVLIFNPLSWTRSDIVEFSIQLPVKSPAIYAQGPDKKPVQFEVLSLDKATNTARIRMLAEDVPSVGYKLISFFPFAPKIPPAPKLLKATANTLENDFIRITVDQQTGCITSLFDKRSKTEALAPAQPGDGAPATTPDGKPCGNLLQTFVDKPKNWDAWNIDADFIKQHTDLMQADEVKLVENSPLRAIIRVRKHFQNSKFVQDITMYPGIDRVDVHMTADWDEKHILLKVAFPLSATNDKATFEIPYGTIQRPTTRRTPQEAAQFEVPALRWADLSDAQHGFSLLNDSKYGYDAKDNVLRLSLLRSPTWPDPHADEGHHEFTYALFPHAAGWQQAMTIHRGYELNYPVLAVPTQTHFGPLPAQQSFFSTTANNVIITSIKKNEDDGALSLRFFEWAGTKGSVPLKLPTGLKVAGTTNLMEKPEGEPASSDSVTVNPYEIKTVRLVRTK